MFKYKIVTYAVDDKGKILTEPRRENVVASSREKAINKCKDMVSNTLKLPKEYIRILQVDSQLFDFLKRT